MFPEDVLLLDWSLELCMAIIHNLIIRIAGFSCNRQLHIRNNLGIGAEVVYRRADVERVIRFIR